MRIINNIFWSHAKLGSPVDIRCKEIVNFLRLATEYGGLTWQGTMNTVSDTAKIYDRAHQFEKSWKNFKREININAIFISGNILCGSCILRKKDRVKTKFDFLIYTNSLCSVNYHWNEPLLVQRNFTTEDQKAKMHCEYLLHSMSSCSCPC